MFRAVYPKEILIVSLHSLVVLLSGWYFTDRVGAVESEELLEERLSHELSGLDSGHCGHHLRDADMFADECDNEFSSFGCEFVSFHELVCLSRPELIVSIIMNPPVRTPRDRIRLRDIMEESRPEYVRIGLTRAMERVDDHARMYPDIPLEVVAWTARRTLEPIDLRHTLTPESYILEVAQRIGRTWEEEYTLDFGLDTLDGESMEESDMRT